MTKISDEISPEDVLYILNNPWKLTESEWGLSGNVNFDYYESYINNKLTFSKEDGFSKIWKTKTDQAIAILGFYKVGAKKYETFFIASKLMEEFGMRVSLDLRRILKEETLNYKGCSCGLYSSSSHPKHIDWFKFIGFTYLPEADNDNKRYFEYISL